MYMICCEKCLESIGKRSTSAAKLWMNMCKSYEQDPDVMKLVGDIDSPELHCLEIMNFIITTEQSDCLMVKLNGYDSAENMFCLDRCSHD